MLSRHQYPNAVCFMWPLHGRLEALAQHAAAPVEMNMKACLHLGMTDSGAWHSLESNH